MKEYSALIVGQPFLVLLLLGAVSLVVWLTSRTGSRFARLGAYGVGVSVGALVSSILISRLYQFGEQVLRLWDALTHSLGPVMADALAILVVIVASGLAGWLGWSLAKRRTHRR